MTDWGGEKRNSFGLSVYFLLKVDCPVTFSYHILTSASANFRSSCGKMNSIGSKLQSEKSSSPGIRIKHLFRTTSTKIQTYLTQAPSRVFASTAGQLTPVINSKGFVKRNSGFCHYRPFHHRIMYSLDSWEVSGLVLRTIQAFLKGFIQPSQHKDLSPSCTLHNLIYLKSKAWACDT